MPKVANLWLMLILQYCRSVPCSWACSKSHCRQII